MTVKLYSTENCPMCNMLKRKLSDAHIDYEVCTDMDIMSQLGIRSVPQLEAEGRLMNLPTAMAYIKSIESGD